MTQEILIIIQSVITAAATIAYILTYRYLSEKVKTMNQTVTTMKNLIDSQTQIIQNIDSYKKIYNPEDFTKAMSLKLENQKIELTRLFEKQAKDFGDNITKGMNDIYIETNKEMLAMIQELVQFPLATTMARFPDKSQKVERDNFIKKYYPHSAAKLIGFCDDWVGGKIPPNVPMK